jgi:hypothetical protein
MNNFEPVGNNPSFPPFPRKKVGPRASEGASVFKPENVNVVIGAGGKLETQFNYTNEQLEEINFQPGLVGAGVFVLQGTINYNKEVLGALAESMAASDLGKTFINSGGNSGNNHCNLLDGFYILTKGDKQYWALMKRGYFQANGDPDMFYSTLGEAVDKRRGDAYGVLVTKQNVELWGFTVGLLQRTLSEDGKLQFVPGLYERHTDNRVKLYFVHDGNKRYYNSISREGALLHYKEGDSGKIILHPENDHVRIKDL